MQISIKEKNEVTLLILSGTLTVDSIYHLKETLNRFDNEKKKDVIVDLGNIKMIDSAGIGSLAYVGKRCRSHGGIMKIASLNETVENVFKILKFDALFEIYPSTEEALRSFKK